MVEDRLSEIWVYLAASPLLWLTATLAPKSTRATGRDRGQVAGMASAVDRVAEAPGEIGVGGDLNRYRRGANAGSFHRPAQSEFRPTDN
jgi:hypothetical protein